MLTVPKLVVIFALAILEFVYLFNIYILKNKIEMNFLLFLWNIFSTIVGNIFIYIAEIAVFIVLCRNIDWFVYLTPIFIIWLLFTIIGKIIFGSVRKLINYLKGY